jgi:hypothetical protein
MKQIIEIEKAPAILICKKLDIIVMVEHIMMHHHL